MKEILAIILLLVLTHSKAISQNISITLPRSQWEEIKMGLERGKQNQELVLILKEALEQADAIRLNQEKIISEYEENTLNYIDLIGQHKTKIRAINEQLEISDFRLKSEQNKRLSLGVFAGFGMGNASSNIQAHIGIGISYQIFKIKL